MAAARSKVGILQPGCPRIALASCPARATHRLTDHPSVRRQCLAFLRQPELSAPVGGRAPGLRSELARLDLSGKFIGNKASFVIFNFRKYRGKYAYPSQKVALAPREISG